MVRATVARPAGRSIPHRPRRSPNSTRSSAYRYSRGPDSATHQTYPATTALIRPNSEPGFRPPRPTRCRVPTGHCSHSRWRKGSRSRERSNRFRPRASIPRRSPLPRLRPKARLLRFVTYISQYTKKLDVFRAAAEIHDSVILCTCERAEKFRQRKKNSLMGLFFSDSSYCAGVVLADGVGGVPPPRIIPGPYPLYP